jgi:glutathione S-transferase
MKLFTNSTTPFGRKVHVAAIEIGVFDRIELRELQTSAVAPDPDLQAANPLGKIPCLVPDDGSALYDSRVICEYLDGLHDGERLYPAVDRWEALRLQALGDGIAEAALLARYETALRPEELRWAAWLEGQLAKVTRALDALEPDADPLVGRLHIGTIALACALGYLDLRHPSLSWRDGRPRLANWYAGMAARPSMQRTAPPT